MVQETKEKVMTTKEITKSIPKIVVKEVTTHVPEEYYVNEPYQEQYIVEVEKERMVPQLYTKEVQETATRPVTKEVQF